MGAKLSRLYRFRLGKSLYDLQIFGYLSHTSFYKPQAVSHFREPVQEGLAFCDRYYRVYRYLFSYTKRYHGDPYVLVLDKYAEAFPAVKATKAAERSRLLREGFAPAACTSLSRNYGMPFGIAASAYR